MTPTIEIARSNKVCIVCYKAFHGYKSNSYCCESCREIGHKRALKARILQKGKLK